MIDLDRIDEYCRRATKAPWQTRFIYRLFRAARESVIVLMQDGPDKDWPNADFIAQARTDLPAVVAELREARELLERLCDGLSAGHGWGEAYEEACEFLKVTE